MCVLGGGGGGGGGRETVDKNKREKVKTKGTHLERFRQGILGGNMIT